MGIAGTLGWLWILIAASGPTSTVRPLEPRAGAAFGYGGSHPRITLRWEDSQPSMLYVLQVVRKTASGNVVATYEIRGEKSFVFRPDACGRYSWWVTGVGAGGQLGRPSKIRAFKVFLRSPVPIAPREGQKFVNGKEPTRVTFNWSRRPVAGYRFEVAGDRGFQRKTKSLIVTGTSTSAGIPRAGKYYWRVCGTRPDTGWSRVQSFKVDSPVPVAVVPSHGDLNHNPPPKPDKPAAGEFPAAPKLQAPRDAARITSVRPRTITLFWQTVGGAAAYEVEISNSAGFSEVKKRRKVNSPVLGLPDPPRGRLFWRVRAVDANGKNGKWSAPWQFAYQVQPLWDE